MPGRNIGTRCGSAPELVETLVRVYGFERYGEPLMAEAFEVQRAIPVPAGAVAEVLERLGRIANDDNAVSDVIERPHPSGQTEIVIVMAPAAADGPLAAAIRTCRDAGVLLRQADVVVRDAVRVTAIRLTALGPGPG